MPVEYREPSAPLKNQEQIANLMVQYFLNISGSHMPYLDQESQAVLIDTNRGNPQEMDDAKEERRQMVEEISRLLDKALKNGKIERISEAQRGEIIEITIKKLVQRRKNLEKR